MYERHRYTDNTKKLQNIDDPVATKKYDGANFFMKIDGEGKPSFVSRRESVKGGFPDRTEKVPHLADIRIPEFKNHVFNVELIHTGKSVDNQESHPLVSGILNSLAPRAVEQQQLHGPIRAVLFDVIDPKVTTYKEKLALMKKVEVSAQKPDLLFVPETKIGKEEIENLIKNTRHQGDEGVIITDLNKPEDENVRIKIKHFKTANLKIKGITQELDQYGNPKESTGAFIVEDSSGREVANVGTGITRETRIQSWQNPKAWIGKAIQVKYMEVAANRLRHPIYNGESDGDLDKI